MSACRPDVVFVAVGFTDVCSILPHDLDELVYPNISPTALTVAALIVGAPKFAFYGGQIWTARPR